MKIFRGKNKNTATPKEAGFVKDYLDTGNATTAIRRNYDVSNPTNSTARVMGNQLLRKPFIQGLLEDMAESALSRIEVLSKTAKNESVKLSANKDILDRAGFAATTKADITSNNETLGLSLYTDEQIKRAAAEIIRENTPDRDAGTTSQE